MCPVIFLSQNSLQWESLPGSKTFIKTPECFWYLFKHFPKVGIHNTNSLLFQRLYFPLTILQKVHARVSYNPGTVALFHNPAPSSARGSMCPECGGLFCSSLLHVVVLISRQGQLLVEIQIQIRSLHNAQLYTPRHVREHLHRP